MSTSRMVLTRAALVLAGTSVGIVCAETALRLNAPAARHFVWPTGFTYTFHPDPVVLPAGGVAADPQSGDAGRQRVAGHAVLVLPRRVELLSSGREHLLRRHADGAQPGARDLRGGSVRGGRAAPAARENT